MNLGSSFTVHICEKTWLFIFSHPQCKTPHEGKKYLSNFSLGYCENNNNNKTSAPEKLLHFSHSTMSFLTDNRPSLC